MPKAPFDFKAELTRARRALEEQVAAYMNDRPLTGYREIAREFKISPAAVCAISRRYGRKRTVGSRGRPEKRATFFIRYLVAGKTFSSNVTVIAPKGTSISAMRAAVLGFFECIEVKRGVKQSVTRRAEYTLRELLATPHV